MTQNEQLSIIPSEVQNPTGIERNIAIINAPLAGFLSHVGLPTENLLSPIDERRKVIQSLESVLEVLAPNDRERATYISKFAICVTVGLFDGALSFLWDETIKALRSRVIGFDLGYFYSIAQSLSSRYKGLRDPEDIAAIGEHDLLEICRRIGFIDDINHRRLDTVNYFRNHASAAHPNEHTISGIELLGFLENCLRYAICAPIDHSVVQVKRLLDNVRQHRIAASDFSAMILEISKLQQSRIDDLFNAFFGIFCDPVSSQDTLENIKGLAPGCWALVNEEFRYRIGARFGYFRANGDVPKKERVQEFLTVVNGNQYKDEDSLGAELIEKLQFLRGAHYGANNFYNEYAHALAIRQSLPSSGVPQAARHDFVKVISTCYIGNGHGYRQGVDENAEPIYVEFIERLSESDYVTFARLFADHEFTTDLHRPKARDRAVQLVKALAANTSNVHLKSALNAIANCPDLQKAHLTGEYRNALKQLP